MRQNVARGVLALSIFAAFFSGSLWAQEKDPATVVLDTSGFWRCHLTLRCCVVQKDGKVEKVPMVAKWMRHDSAFPPSGWTDVDFDDGSWPRSAGVFVSLVSRRNYDGKSPLVALACRRAKFTVTDPNRVKGLTLSVSYRGGVVVYLNGTEIARRHLPKNGKTSFDTLAEPYPPTATGDAKARIRTLADVHVPNGFLRKGVNVLAVEIHRAPYSEGDVSRNTRGYPSTKILWGSCGLESLELKATGTEGIVPNVARPKGLQVWNSDLHQSDFDLDWADPGEPVRPIRLVGTPGGGFSGKVVVGSTEPIRNLRAVVSDLEAVKGRARIPASTVEVRYGLPWQSEACAAARYAVSVNRFDALVESAPKEIPVRVKLPVRGSRKVPGQPQPVFGAVVPVWVTVNVPEPATAGDYEGTLTISMSGKEPVKVPVKMTVCAWRLPPPSEYRTFAEFIQSPDTLALEYKVPLWSEKHFRMIEQSLRLLGRTGNKSVYLPLICEMNLGNEQSMVRWKKKPGGGYDYDFTVFDRYLDLVEKHQGKPAVVVLGVWDIFLEGTWYASQKMHIRQNVRDDRNAHEGLGPQVTAVDADGKLTRLRLPQYSDPKSSRVWKPLLDELRRRMQRRGLEGALLLGMLTDSLPTKAVTERFGELMPGVGWISQAHPRREKVHGVPVGYSSFVWHGYFAIDPEREPGHGWNLPKVWLHFPRAKIDPFAMTTHRFLGEVNVAGSQRGFARLGGDFWPVMRDRRGVRRVRISEGRYPKSTWRNLNIVTGYLAPGPDGPVATARLAVVREGIQECEARIFIEKTLADDKARATLGETLAGHCRNVLNERTLALRRGITCLYLRDGIALNAGVRHSWWEASPTVGSQWFIHSGWQRRSDELFTVAAKIDTILHPQRTHIGGRTVRERDN